MIRRPGLLFGLLLLVSLGLHLGVAFRLCFPGPFLVFPLTAGLFFAWLYSSRIISDTIRRAPENESPFAFLASFIPAGLKYPLIFLLLYALSNFFMSLAPASSGGGLFDLTIDPHKLRGLSGFWMFFYALAAVMARVRQHTSFPSKEES